ncbi:MAG: T9SS type A sorting domain-containing protein, partial [Bacteroidales bacterium]|nr:T9SS type A sorting domain-containing protein [Bacteroidales bacterium]
WDIVPSAILLLGDYGTNATNSVISPIYNNYCVSDNIYGDIDGNHMPDIITARMTANNASQLETMVTKFINYERNPPTDPDFYDHPITALGFQTERWFQICTESVAGYWENVLGKSPQRENAIYSGTPGSSWSSANNTYTVVNYFGPNGLGYIPSAPTGINCSWDASATSVVDALNSGGFILLHRDHGAETLWGEPDFSNSDVEDLTNSDLSYIWSVNCLTGKYNYGGECLVEKLHRHTFGGQNAGALGAIGDSEVSYSFVNDTYVWGAFDFMWPDFMPDYGSTPEPRGIMPSFANAAGKYFLQASSWPYNEDNKEVTFNLFHHHGDGFLTLYSEVPQSLTVLHNGQLLAGNNSFEVTADEGSLIALTVDGEIIATAVGTGEPLEISIPPQQEGSQMIVTVTMQNFYRHQSMVDVISSNIAYVIKDDYEMNEVAGNGNGLMDYGETISLSVTMENIGTVAAVNVVVNLTSDNSFIAITDNTENFGNMQPGSIVSIEDCFQFEVDHLIPDNENIFFNLEATDGADTWVSQIVIKSHAPVLEFMGFEISDPAGNNNGRIDPGETVDIMITVENSGSSDAMNVLGEMGSSDPFIILNTTSQNYGFLNAGSQAHKTYSVTAVASTPEGHQVDYSFDITCDGGIQINTGFYTVIGKYTALVLDLDPQNFSGPGIYETFENMEITAVYETTFPEDLGIYKNIFISLGIQFQNYELSLEEGQELKDFLLEGGNIYMEGRSTWKTDQQTEVHPMFNIDVEDVYTFIIQNIKGVDGTFTAGMLFDFDGVNPINNYSIEPVGSAFGILTVGDQEYGCGVANEAGTYKTIASTIEFGRLVDNEPPSTRIELMQQYLDWFNGIVTGTEDGISKINPSQFEISPNPFDQNTSVQFSLEQENDVTIKIHNLQGQPVKTLIEKSKLNPGIHRMSWDGTGKQGEKLNSGIYFIIFQSGNKQIIHKIILTK